MRTRTGLPSIATWSPHDTRWPTCATSPFTLTRPSTIICSRSRREPTPDCASTFCNFGASASGARMRRSGATPVAAASSSLAGVAAGASITSSAGGSSVLGESSLSKLPSCTMAKTSPASGIGGRDASSTGNSAAPPSRASRPSLPLRPRRRLRRGRCEAAPASPVSPACSGPPSLASAESLGADDTASTAGSALSALSPSAAPSTAATLAGARRRRGRGAGLSSVGATAGTASSASGSWLMKQSIQNRRGSAGGAWRCVLRRPRHRERASLVRRPSPPRPSSRAGP